MVRLRARGAAGERAPRLVLRFAVFTALGLAAAAAAILLVVRHADVVQAERSAIDRAQLLAEAVLRHELRSADLDGPARGARRSELDALFRGRVLAEGTLRATVYAPSGVAGYSTDHRLIGFRSHDRRRLREALRGEVVATVETGPGAEAEKVLVAYVPVAVGREDRRAVIALEQDYAPIAAAARQTFAPIAGVLEAVLVLLFLLLAPVLARVSRRIRSHVAELDRIATHDDLTGLPNRLGFGRALGAELCSTQWPPPAVVVVEIDRLEEVNNALGAEAGDRLLAEAARRVVSEAGDAPVARLGSDEFAVLVRGGGARVAVDASSGIAFGLPGEDARAVLRRAGVALRIASDRRTGVEVYDPSDDASDVAALTLSAELREAIESDQLVVHYQLQADVSTGAPRGVEALVRWQHPDRGLLSPAAFLPAAKATGLVKDVGRRVLELAAADWRRWRGLGLELDLSVNLTAADLLDLSLPDEVAAVLANAEMSADRLLLEVTESTLMGDELRAGQVLTRLVDLGVRVAVDDFGTGYSSLAQLRRLPVHEVKIDRSFVAGIPDDPVACSMVRWTVDLAHNLGLHAVAEGVERVEQLNYLRGIGCEVAQGYLLSRPVPSDELVRLVGRNRVRLGVAA
jgi:diguanylate cyclase